MTDVTKAKIDIGAVIGQAFEQLGRNFGPFVVMAAILVGIPAAVSGILQLMALDGNPGLRILVGIVNILGGLAGLVLQAAIIRISAGELDGRRPDVGASLGAGLRKLLPLVGLVIVIGLAVGVGVVLLIVPGVMIGLVWSVAVPSYVVERIGVFDALRRSADLTRGNRWRILGLYLLFGIAVLLVDMVVFTIGGGVFAVAQGRGGLLVLVLTVVVGMLSAMLGATLAAVLYTDLRRAKEGIGAEGLAAVFD
jgi:hypothetical protein